jgi:hypothetical protein
MPEEETDPNTRIVRGFKRRLDRRTSMPANVKAAACGRPFEERGGDLLPQRHLGVQKTVIWR